MDDFVLLDTETTGNDLLTDRLFQVCYKYEDVLRSEYFKPEVPISVKSQSITHVTNKMVADRPSFSGSKFKSELQDVINKSIVVAHNAVFDIAMLTHDGVEVPRFICTLKLARYLDPEGVIPEYNLQYLRYFLELDVKAEAHDAKGDVKVLEALFHRLYKKILDQSENHEQAVEKMLKITQEPSLFKTFPFGKHKGHKIDEVVIIDRPYVEWLLERKNENPEGEEDWIFTLKHYLKIA